MILPLKYKLDKYHVIAKVCIKNLNLKKNIFFFKLGNIWIDNLVVSINGCFYD